METVNKQQLEIQNLKCGGCANTIQKGLTEIEGVSDVQVDETMNIVTFTAEDTLMDTVVAKLDSLGYPAVGTNNSILKKANSYVSCVRGRMQ